MTDINELREKITIKGLDVVADTDILAVLDRLEATEEDRSRFLVEMGRLCAQCDALRAKIAEMEKQEPAGYGVRYVEPTNGEEDWDSIWKYRVFAEDHIKDFTQAYADVGEPVGASTVVPLYALPGARSQPAPSVREGWKLVPIEPTQEMLDATSWPNCAGTDYKKMLAAAPRPEAKP